MPASSSTLQRSKSRWPNPDVAIASSLVAVATVLPLLFWIGTDETFALPKLIAIAVATLLGVAAAGWLLLGSDAGSLPRMRAPDWLVVAFLIWLSVSFWLSIDQRQSFLGEPLQRQGFLAMAGYVAAYFLARIAITDQVRLRLLLRGAAIAGTATAAYGLMQRSGFDPIWSEVPGGRVFSTIGQSNALGAYLAMSIPLTMAITPNGTRQWIIKATVIGIQVAALVLTFSRGAYLGLAAGVLVLGIVAFRGWSRQQRWVAPLVAGVGLLVLAALVPLSPFQAEADRAGTRLIESFNTEDGSVRAHFDFWEVGLAMSADRPLAGSGPDTYALLFPEYRDKTLTPERAAPYLPYRVESPHNVYLAIATGSGIPATIVYVALIITVIWVGVRFAWRNADRGPALMIGGAVAAVTSHTITDSFMTAELAGSWLAWALLGALVGVVAGGEDRTVSSSSLNV